MSKSRVLFEDLKLFSRKVKHILQTIPTSRDSNGNFISSYYYQEIGNENIKSMSAFELLHKVSSGELPCGETLLRTKRRLQKNHIELRGSKYKERKPKPTFEYVVRNRD